MDPAFVPSLVEVVGAGHVLTDPGVTAGYARDWTGRFVGATPAVVRPGSRAEVAEVVRRCAAAGVALVPQGGNTGLVGGGVPLAGELVVSLRRLDTVSDVDPVAGQLTAGAGATVAAVHAAARAAGWAYAVDFGARDSATIGGSIATNAGGLHVVRHGATRQQLLGVEAVLGDGRVVSHLGGLVKDNTGYDLGGLLCGSEGTLGLVTAARLRLVPDLGARVTALVGFASAAEAVAAAGGLRRSLPSLEALELVTADGVELVCGHLGLPLPFPGRPPVLLLVEAAALTDPTGELAAAVAALAALDTAVATDPPRRRQLWAYREAHTEAINALGPPHKLDVTLPAAALAPFMDEVVACVAKVAPTARTWLFGHAGDGNIHVNVTGVPPDDERVDDAVLTLVARSGGSISAEHGIGTAKRRWLHLNRSDDELAAFRAIKRALDPVGILNPNVLLP